MWLRLLLLLIYVATLFLLARMLEAVSWMESGHLSRRLLDPMTLSVLKLKALLEQRGVSFETAVEKQDLTDLVEATGAVTEEELEETSSVEVSPVTNFSTGSHFLEQVEDAKDSVWLVKVNSDQHPFNYLVDTSWKAIKQKMDRFGVRVGNFDCKLDRRFCRYKTWESSRLILGLPLNFESKSQVFLHTYTGSYKTQNIYNWIKATVNQKVSIIRSKTEFRGEWLQYRPPSKSSEVRVVMFSESELMPLFYSALSVKFPGRVKFALANRRLIRGSFDDTTLEEKVANWTYFVITKERTFLFGKRPAESVTFRSLDIFLRSLYPSLNDIFVFSLIFCNCLTIFELSFVQGSFFRRVVKYIWCAVKFNIALLLIWMMLLTLFQLKIFSELVEFGLKLLRLIGGSDFFSLVKSDYNFFSNHPLLVEVLLVLYLFLIGYIYRKRNESENVEDAENSPEWNFAQFRTLEHLFYPIQPRSLMNRNAMSEWNHQEIPSLWAAVHMSTDYIHLLPLWEYQTKQSLDSDNEEDFDRNIPSNGGESISPEKDTPVKRFLQENVSDTCSTNESELENEDSATFQESQSTEKKFHKAVEKLPPRICPEGYIEGTQCVICLDNYSEGVMLCGLPCGHCFHRKCIIVWLMRDNHFCPVCRWPSNKPKIEMHLHSE